MLPAALAANPTVIKAMTIAELATLIRSDWKKVYFGAVPYLDAMGQMDKVTDSYGLDPGKEIVNYFLANANTWRGEVARAVKKELNLRVKEAL